MDVFELPVRQFCPGVFAPILHQDWSQNSPSNPVERGSIVTFFMTGVGPYDVPTEDGSQGPLGPPFPLVPQEVRVIVGEQPAEVLFAGQAPGVIAGVVLLNVRIPAGLPGPGAYSMTVWVGPRIVLAWNYATQPFRVYVR